MKLGSNVKFGKFVDRAIFTAVLFVVVFAFMVKLEGVDIQPSPAPGLDLKSTSTAATDLCAMAFGKTSTEYTACLQRAEGKVETKQGKPPVTGVKTGVQIWAGKSVLKAQYLQTLFDELDKSGIPYLIKIYYNEGDQLYRYVISPVDQAQYVALFSYMSKNTALRAIFIVPKVAAPEVAPPAQAEPAVTPATPEQPTTAPVDAEKPYGEIASSLIYDNGGIFSRSVTVRNTYAVKGYGESFTTPETSTLPVVGVYKLLEIKITSGGKILETWNIKLEPKSVETGKIDADLANILDSYGNSLCDALRILQYKSPAGYTYPQLYKKIKAEQYNEWKVMPDPDNLERAVSTYEQWGDIPRNQWACDERNK